MFETEECITFFYNQDDNLFVDENGFTVYSLFEYITPNELLWFKTYKEDWAFLSKKRDQIVELIWSKYVY